MPGRTSFPLADQHSLQKTIIECDLDRIACRVPFPKWLGYVGVVLAYTEDAEQRNLEITRALSPQLLRLVGEGTPAGLMLDRLLNEERPLTWQSLGTIETFYCGPRPGGSA